MKAFGQFAFMLFLMIGVVVSESAAAFGVSMEADFVMTTEVLSIMELREEGALNAAEWVQRTARISGTVVHAVTGESLPGANITIEGTPQIGTATNLEGDFTITIPDGSHTLLIQYIGFDTVELEVSAGNRIIIEEFGINVARGDEAQLVIQLTPAEAMLDELTVTAYRRGQQRAINQQREASNIINVVDAELISAFPDPNVGESLKRIPGINIQSDQGEARYIQIRGTSPTFSNISINGEQIAAPEGDERSVALDMIPSDLLSSIEVTKAITPDMDGDAIGGAVNLNTMSALTDDRVFNITVNGGYHDMVRDQSPIGRRATLNYGQRTGSRNQFGYMLGGHYSMNTLASDNNEMVYDEGDLEELQLRNYELSRERIGLTSSFDYRFHELSSLYFNTSLNVFEDHEYRRRMVAEPDVISRDLKDRKERQRIFSTMAGGRHFLGNGFNIDYRLAYSYSDQKTPRDRSIVFEQAHEDDEGDDIDFVGFDQSDMNFPRVLMTPDAPASAGLYNYGLFEFDEFVDAEEFTSEQHFSTRLNMSKQFDLSDRSSGVLKFGGAVRLKSKELDLTESVYDYDGSSDFQGLIGSYNPGSSYLRGKYPGGGIGQFSDPGKMHDLFDLNRADFEMDEEDTIEASNAEDYTATENTYAGYVMTDLQLGQLGAVIGVRYEHVASEYTGNIIEFDDEDDLVLPIPSTTDKLAHDFILPMVHLKYNLQNRANIRLAWTNTFAKPNYIDLVPYRIIERVSEEIELGNPDLNPVRSMNLDFMTEYFIGTEGLISFGVFYKNLRDFIYLSRFSFAEAGPYTGYRATQPVNGDDADLFGVEVALQQQLAFLPGFAKGFGLYANYTYTKSEARLTSPGGTLRTTSLPGQAANVANFALSYDHYGFSGRISLNYSGDFITEIRETNDDDQYYDSRSQVDLSLSQQITPRMQLFADLINITNEPLRYYNGIPLRPEQQEYYSWRGNLGVRFSF